MFTDQVDYNYNMFSPPLSPDPAWELPPIKQGLRQLTLEEWMNRSKKKIQNIEPKDQNVEKPAPPPLVPIKPFTIPKVSMKHPPEPKLPITQNIEPIGIIESDSESEFHEEFHEEETQEEEDTEDESEHEEYEVDQVLDRDYRFDEESGTNCYFYKLHFKGYPPNETQWTPSYACGGCRRLISNFNHKLNARKKRLSSIEGRIELARERIQEKRQLIKELEKDKEANRNKIRAEKGAICRLESGIIKMKKSQNEPQSQKTPNVEPEPSLDEKKKMLIEGMQKLNEFFQQFSQFLP